MRYSLTMIGLALSVLWAAGASAPAAPAPKPFMLGQAMVPPTGMEDDKNPMSIDERMQRRFPQKVRVGDLVGLPVLDDSSSTLGHVRQVVRSEDGKIALIVAYGGFLGWGTRPVAVPIEAVGILGREIASLDMSPREYARSPTWKNSGARALPDDAIIKIALARR